MDKQEQYLTQEQVYELNVKHGWFQFGDAQGDVSRSFAQDAIATHERMRAAAPVMLAALREAEGAVRELCEGQDPENQCWVVLKNIEAAIAAAGAT